MSVGITSCNSNQNNNKPGSQVVVNESQPNIGENLNLKGVGEIVRNSRNPEEIEKKLNEPGGVNNLDLDHDGKIDYLKVTEYGSGAEHGYSICAVLQDGDPEVTNVVVNTANSQMTINGNPAYYGNQNNTYQSTFTTTDFLLLAWMMQPHYSYYHSPYYYGHYGYGYGPRPILSYNAYHSSPYIRTVTTTRTYTTVSRPSTTIHSPNANNTSSIAKRASLSNHTTSQKSFKSNTGDNHRTVTGFGNKPSRSSSGFGSSPSRSSSTPSRSSGFGSSSRGRRR